MPFPLEGANSHHLYTHSELKRFFPVALTTPPYNQSERPCHPTVWAVPVPEAAPVHWKKPILRGRALPPAEREPVPHWKRAVPQARAFLPRRRQKAARYRTKAVLYTEWSSTSSRASYSATQGPSSFFRTPCGTPPQGRPPAPAPVSDHRSGAGARG